MDIDCNEPKPLKRTKAKEGPLISLLPPNIEHYAPEISDFEGQVFKFDGPKVPERKHNHYFKDVSRLDVIDVYRVLALFNVTDAALSHAIKKILVAGGRGAGKDITTDIQEAIDTLVRWQAMREEDLDSSQRPAEPPVSAERLRDADIFKSFAVRSEGYPCPSCKSPLPTTGWM